MSDNEITALAREYAEEIIKKKELMGKDANMLFEAILSNIEKFLPWLLRRYCLVEKSVIKETWKEITNVYLAHQHITYDGARYLFNEVLFPGIGKEVEE